MSALPLIEPPRAAPWLAPYWEGVARRELRLPRCSVCGRWEWYPQPTGPACAGGHYRWQALAPGATVFTFTRVERPLLAGVSEPYLVGLVCPDDAPECRIATRLEAPAGIAIGRRARLAFAGLGAHLHPYYLVEVAS